MRERHCQLGDGLTRAGKRDSSRVTAITTDAFSDDPFNRWLFGNPKAMGGVFGALARHVYCDRGFAYTLGDEGAVMAMLPGGRMEPPVVAMPALYWSIIGHASPGAYRRVKRSVAAMEQAHPNFPHVYVFTIGVRRDKQGKGIGCKLMQPILDHCDANGLPIYLENSNPANGAFYEACGFARAGAIDVGEDAPQLTPMLRKACST